MVALLTLLSLCSFYNSFPQQFCLASSLCHSRVFLSQPARAPVTNRTAARVTGGIQTFYLLTSMHSPSQRSSQRCGTVCDLFHFGDPARALLHSRLPPLPARGHRCVHVHCASAPALSVVAYLNASRCCLYAASIQRLIQAQLHAVTRDHGMFCWRCRWDKPRKHEAAAVLPRIFVVPSMRLHQLLSSFVHPPTPRKLPRAAGHAGGPRE